MNIIESESVNDVNESTPLNIAFRDFVSKSDHKMEYQVEDQYNILFKIHGSIWPRVFPWCLFNISVAFLVRYFHHHASYTIDLSYDSSGQGFMGLLVSFLVISRSTNAYWGWIGSRQRIMDLMRKFRELAHLMVTFTRHDTSANAAKWRFEVSRRAIILLRVIVAVLEYDRKEQNIWQLPELTPQEKKAILHSVGGAIERAPVILSLFVRTAIGSHIKYLNSPLDVVEELKLLDCTVDVMSSYYQMVMLLNTFFPFPLEQMGRTFLFAYVFTLPFSLENDIEQTFPYLFMIFFITYGFIGLELINIDLGDPFGDTDLELDSFGLAEVVFDDIYIAIHDIDGAEAAKKLEDSIKGAIDYEESSMHKHKVHTHATGDWHTEWGGDFGEGFEVDALHKPPRKDSGSFRGISARDLFSNIFKGSCEGEDGSVSLFDSDEKIEIDLSRGSVVSRTRSWTAEYKKRQNLY